MGKIVTLKREAALILVPVQQLMSKNPKTRMHIQLCRTRNRADEQAVLQTRHTVVRLPRDETFNKEARLIALCVMASVDTDLVLVRH